MPEFEVRQTASLPANPPPIVSIGLGGIVHDAHYPAYAIAGFDVVGGFDINVERAAMMRDKFNIPRLYDSLSHALETGAGGRRIRYCRTGKRHRRYLARDSKRSRRCLSRSRWEKIWPKPSKS